MLQFPATATTLHYEFYTEEKGALSQASCIHLENVDRLSTLPSEIMDGLIEAFHVPKEGQVSILFLYTGCRKVQELLSSFWIDRYINVILPPTYCNIFMVFMRDERVSPHFENLLMKTTETKLFTGRCKKFVI